VGWIQATHATRSWRTWCGLNGALGAETDLGEIVFLGRRMEVGWDEVLVMTRRMVCGHHTTLWCPCGGLRALVLLLIAAATQDADSCMRAV
jgi:hypothetical protein